MRKCAKNTIISGKCTIMSRGKETLTRINKRLKTPLRAIKTKLDTSMATKKTKNPQTRKAVSTKTKTSKMSLIDTTRLEKLLMKIQDRNGKTGSSKVGGLRKTFSGKSS